MVATLACARLHEVSALRGVICSEYYSYCCLLLCGLLLWTSNCCDVFLAGLVCCKVTECIDCPVAHLTTLVAHAEHNILARDRSSKFSANSFRQRPRKRTRRAVEASAGAQRTTAGAFTQAAACHQLSLGYSHVLHRFDDFLRVFPGGHTMHGHRC